MTTIRVPLDPKVRQLYDEVHRLSQEQFLRQVGKDHSGIRVSMASMEIGVVLSTPEFHRCRPMR